MGSIESRSAVKVHFFYITLMLVLAIIGLVTYKWTGIEGFREYLTVGATLTSLVLGVLAIIYSFVSTGQQSTTLGAVQAAAWTTSDAVGKLDGFMSSAQALQAEAGRRTADLHVLTQSLASSVDEIRQETKTLAAASGEVAGKVNQLPSQLGELRNLLEKSGKSSPDSPPSAPPAPEQWSQSAIKQSLQVASHYGLAVTEALVGAAALKWHLSIPQLAAALGNVDAGYLWGYLVGFGQTQLVKITQQEGQPNVYQVRWVHPALQTQLDAEWQRRLDSAAPELKAWIAEARSAAKKAVVNPQTSAAATPKPAKAGNVEAEPEL